MVDEVRMHDLVDDFDLPRLKTSNGIRSDNRL